jgi:serine/threonine protein kinase
MKSLDGPGGGDKIAYYLLKRYSQSMGLTSCLDFLESTNLAMLRLNEAIVSIKVLLNHNMSSSCNDPCLNLLNKSLCVRFDIAVYECSVVYDAFSLLCSQTGSDHLLSSLDSSILENPFPNSAFVSPVASQSTYPTFSLTSQISPQNYHIINTLRQALNIKVDQGEVSLSSVNDLTLTFIPPPVVHRLVSRSQQSLRISGNPKFHPSRISSLVETSQLQLKKLQALQSAIEPMLRLAYSFVKTFAFTQFTNNEPLWRAYLDLRLFADTSSLTSITSCDFAWIRRIGKGGYGSVFECRKLDTGIRYAIKRISKKAIKHQRAFNLVLNERLAMEAIMSSPGHAGSLEDSHRVSIFDEHGSPFVCGIKYAFQNSENVYFVSELKSCDLDSLLQQHGHFSVETAKFYLACTLLGIKHLHERGLSHRDIKPANILIDSRGYSSLTDLGLALFVSNARLTHISQQSDLRMQARVIRQETTSNVDIAEPTLVGDFELGRSVRICSGLTDDEDSCDEEGSDHPMRAFSTNHPPTTLLTARGKAGTPGFWAPEMLRTDLGSKSGTFNGGVDYWSFGCLAYLLLVGRGPFSSKAGTTDEENKATLLGEVDFSSDIFGPSCSSSDGDSNEAECFIRDLLDNNSVTRLGCGLDGHHEVMHHPFFRNIDWVRLKAMQLAPPKLHSFGEKNISNVDVLAAELEVSFMRLSVSKNALTDSYQSANLPPESLQVIQSAFIKDRESYSDVRSRYNAEAKPTEAELLKEEEISNLTLLPSETEAFANIDYMSRRSIEGEIIFSLDSRKQLETRHSDNPQDLLSWFGVVPLAQTEMLKISEANSHEKLLEVSRQMMSWLSPKSSLDAHESDAYLKRKASEYLPEDGLLGDLKDKKRRSAHMKRATAPLTDDQ